MSNGEIRRLFNLFAELLLLHQQDERLAALLSGAAYRIGRSDEDVLRLPVAGIAKLFRPEIVGLLNELNKTGAIATLDELIQLTPSGLFEMMRIKGLGGKKLAALWHIAEIDSIDSLLKACQSNQLSLIPGFGTKTQKNIIASIENYRNAQDRFHYASVADAATSLTKELRTKFKTKLFCLCGEVRRQSTTVKGIEWITALPSRRFKNGAMKKLVLVEKTDKATTKGHTLDEIPFVIYHVPQNQFYLELFKKTGNEQHIAKVLGKLNGRQTFASEHEIYRQAGIRYIVPEMREDVAEWKKSFSDEDLIGREDIKGVVHNHTSWSDGVDSLLHFVNACKTRNYEYTVISDHSKNAHYAGGLKEEKVLRQMEEIDRLNKKLSPFKIFKSIECDILISGELDYNKDLLKKFDLVIVSIHQLLKMSEEKATARLIKAIENPYTTIVGHMSGRQLLIRPGYPVNYKKVIDACAANNVIIEINANPYRLDMDWSHIPYAMKKGVMISINPDAHSIGEIDNIQWGVSAARKGGLTKHMTWNAMPLKKIMSWLSSRQPH